MLDYLISCLAKLLSIATCFLLQQVVTDHSHFSCNTVSLPCGYERVSITYKLPTSNEHPTTEKGPFGALSEAGLQSIYVYCSGRFSARS